MDNCIFCKIISGELPSATIYEDDDFLAFLDLFPMTEGYTLVIPKKHYRWVWDVENVGEYFEVCKKIALHFQKVTNKGAVYSMILGEEVPHAHIRMIPDKDDKYINAVTKMLESAKNEGIISELDDETIQEVLNKYKLS